MGDTSHASPDKEADADLAASLKIELKKTAEFSSKCCIYKVPVGIYLENDKSYSPRVVSIGPLHRDIPDLKPMEEHKLLYLKSFLERTGLLLEDYVKNVEGHEEEVRNHYAEKFEGISSREFVKMIVLDSAFLVELLWRYSDSAENQVQNDRVLNKPWKVNDVRYDLMLLENQLPFFVLEKIFKLSALELSPEIKAIARGRGLSVERVSLIKLTHRFFRFKAYLGERDGVDSFLGRTGQEFEIMHFVDFFRKFHVPAVIPRASEIKTLRVPSATKLYEAGVKFEAGPTKSIKFDIKFRGRTLVIPPLQIRRSTESFLLNIVAYERCHLKECYVSDYLFLVDRLVDSVEAVELLARKGVIETNLADHQDVVASIDRLVRGSTLRSKHFHFNELCDGLNRYLEDPWNKRIATIKQTHFSSLLTAFYVLVAFSIFVLTLIQTICSCGVQFE